MNLILAAVVSMLLGVAAALLADAFDASVRDPEQIHRTYHTDMLGTLPAVRDNRLLIPIHAGKESKAGLVPNNAQRQRQAVSAFDEGVRMVRNAILLADFDRRLRSILVTSATPGEGKSTVAMHVAMSHADQGRKTLLIDADLRRPSLDKKMGLNVSSGKGLSSVLTGDATWQGVVVQVPYSPNLSVLPAGNASRRTSDLVGAMIPEILDEAYSLYDLIIIDAPPMLGFAEPMQIATAVDGVLLLAVPGETSKKAIASVMAALRRLRANVLGVVFNRVSKTSTSSYYYYNYYYYRYGNPAYEKQKTV